ncbi:MAG: hypothetical protein ACE5KH_00740 [Candidatus Geothermarchaeales archaeon]
MEKVERVETKEKRLAYLAEEIHSWRDEVYALRHDLFNLKAERREVTDLETFRGYDTRVRSIKLQIPVLQGRIRALQHEHDSLKDELQHPRPPP